MKPIKERTRKDTSSEQKKMKLKTGYDNSGRPYFDLNDEHTAEMFIKQAPKFAKVTLS